MYGIYYQLIVCMPVVLICVHEQNRQIFCKGELPLE